MTPSRIVMGEGYSAKAPAKTALGFGRHRQAVGAITPSEEVTEEVTGEVARLLRVMVGDMPRQLIQSSLGLKSAEHFRTAYLKPALAVGAIAMTLPDKPRSSKQRYRLTDFGQHWLRTQSSPAKD